MFAKMEQNDGFCASLVAGCGSVVMVSLNFFYGR